MKKYIMIIIFIMLFMLINFKESYSFYDCFNVIYPKEVSSFNLKEFLMKNNYYDIAEICYNEICYFVNTSNIDDIVYNYELIYKNSVNTDDNLIYRVKGYPVNKIKLNYCL